MKRTCETCKHFCESFVEGQYRCFRTTPAVSRAWDSPACEHYELSKSDLEMAFDNSLAKACKKHPDFVAIPAGKRAHAIGTAAGNMARKLKAYLMGESMPMCHEDYQLEVALKSELYEFLEAFHCGDFERALSEAGDVVAVLYRALNGDGKEVRHE